MTADNETREDRFDRLRRQAKDLLRHQPEESADAPTDILELIHELRISQTELEIQNEELQRAHREITGLHHEYLDLYERAPCGHITLNAKGIITRINHVGRTLLGADGKKMTSLGFSRYIAPGWEDFYWTALKRSGKTGEKQSLELKLTPKDGFHLWVQADILADRGSDAEVAQWRLTIVDITAKKAAEQALKKSDAFAIKVTNSSLCAVYIYNMKAGHIVYINPQFTRMSGLSLEALANIEKADFLKRFHPKDRPALAAHGEALAAASDDEVFEVAYRFKKLDGSWMSCLSRNAVFSRDADGTLRELIGTSLDITALKRAEEKLKALNTNLESLVAERTALAKYRAEQLQQLALDLTRAEDEERRRLAAILHDDLQQHMAYIKLRANLATQAYDIREDHPTGLEFETISDLIQESIDKCRKLSHELTPAELQRDGLLSALETMVDDFKNRYGLRVNMDVDPASEPASSMLSSILFRTIREFLYNIVKHSEADNAALKISMDTDQIIVNVSDPGKGCNLDEVRTRKGSDSGFGLFSIKDRMTFLGGQAEFRSAPGKGFCASLKIPKIIDSFTKD